jgi:putative ABC transport system permease protein
MRLPWRSRRQREDDLRAEIEAHLRMAIADRVARGQSREDAERAARREFGNVPHISEVTREMWGGMWLDRLARDLSYGARGLRRAPGFAAVAVLTLALGVGANAAVFTVVNGVLLRPLPFDRPHELMLISYEETDSVFERPPSMYEGMFVEFRDHNRTFERVASFNRAQISLTGAGEPVRLPAALVTADFMAVLGVDAALGRTFATGEDIPGNEQVVVLGDRVWRERFFADAGVVGRAVTLNGQPYTVIGVMPPGFAFPYDARLWVPMVIRLAPNVSFVRPVVGRLEAGATREQAALELVRIAASEGWGLGPGREMSARVVPLKDLLTSDVERSLLIFSGAVAFVLLIACANVANLLLVRAAGRRHEIVLRAALGASRARIVRQLLTESVLVALLGGVAGILLSFWGVRVLLAIAPAGRIPRVDEIQVDGTVLAVSLVATLLAGMAFGLAPALAVTRRRLSEGLGEGGRALGGGDDHLRRSLVVAEIALSIVLLTGAGLLLRSFSMMREVDPGFRPEHVVAMTLDLPETDYPGAPEMQAFHGALLERLTRIPSVEQAGAVNWAPLTGNLLMGDIYIEESGQAPRGQGFVDKMITTPGYFRAMGIELVHGRGFTAQDDGSAPGAVVISRSVATRFWPPNGADAIGKRLTGRDEPKPEDWLTIVGVVDDVAQTGLTRGRQPAMYAPVLQTQRTFFLNSMTFVVRTQRAPQEVMRAMRAMVGELDPDLPVSALTTMDDLVSRTVSEPRFESRLLSAFSLIALFLAAIGTYGVLAYDVASRTREIGLRVALGATTGDVVTMVLRRAASVAVPGILLGIMGALALTRVLASSLFEVTPTDPLTFAAVSATLLAVALVAAVVPTRRATKVNPLRALRQE